MKKDAASIELNVVAAAAAAAVVVVVRVNYFVPHICCAAL